MTRFDQKRLEADVLALDVDGLRAGRYSDKYFANIVQILEGLQAENYHYAGQSPRGVDAVGLVIGDVEVEAQVFNRHAPGALVAGVDVALQMLKACTGYFDGGKFVSTWDSLEVEAVHDGDFTEYAGDPMRVQPVLKIRGKYRDFALLETPVLGVLSRATRIASQVYEVLRAANGKSVLFFPARFDLPSVQSLDGYAYWLAIQTYNHESGHDLRALVSTDAQGAWWGGRGGGTVPHAIIACFLADTVEVMRAFARHIPPDVVRIALVDFDNDVVRDALAVMDAFWSEYLAAAQADDAEGMKRWRLDGVRPDTNYNMVDASLAEGDEGGVSAKLVHLLRDAMDGAWHRWQIPHGYEALAKAFCERVQIVATGGFSAARIRAFEEAGVPTGSYGVGSTFLRNDGSFDYTMDVVRVKVNGEWVDMAKAGRQPGTHPHLETVNREENLHG